jgi:hypothetical protein
MIFATAAWKKKNVILKKTAQYTSASVGCKVCTLSRSKLEPRNYCGGANAGAI